jgi:hypothetical protein
VSEILNDQTSLLHLVQSTHDSISIVGKPQLTTIFINIHTSTT